MRAAVRALPFSAWPSRQHGHRGRRWKEPCPARLGALVAAARRRRSSRCLSSLSPGSLAIRGGSTRLGLEPRSSRGTQMQALAHHLRRGAGTFRVGDWRRRCASTCGRASRRGAPRATAEGAEGGSDGGRLQGVASNVRHPPSAAATFRSGRVARRSQGDAGGPRAVEQRVRQWKVEDGGREAARLAPRRTTQSKPRARGELAASQVGLWQKGP